MTLTHFVYKTHKWLAVGVGLATFLWFLSGMVMMLPRDLLSRSSAPGAAAPERPPTPAFQDVSVAVPQAIAVLEAAAGGRVEVTGVAFRRLPGQLLYEISTADAGTYLVNAVDGTRVVITPDFARQLAARALGDRGQLGEVSLHREHDSDYPYGPLPVYRIPANDSRATIFYVAVATGELRATTRLGRIRSFLAGTHTFDFLRPELSDRSVRLALFAFSAVGTLLSVFGFWILWIQLRSWRLRRKAA